MTGIFIAPLSRRAKVGLPLFLMIAIASLLGTLPVKAQEQQKQNGIEHAKGLSLAFRQAAQAVTPAVVTIRAKVTISDEDSSDRLPFDLPPGFRLPEGFKLFEPRSVGSGVIIDAEGIVLTNSHVVRDADEIWVQLSDKREFRANDVRMDQLSDLAILHINADEKLKPAQLGDSSELGIGDWVIAIGSPFELEATVSAGIISGKGRSVNQIRRGKLLQTDAAINPGNSGGPLVNLDGEVIGINTAIASSSGGYQGIGFAIPSNQAKWIVRQLVDNGRVRRAYLGIGIRDISPALARARNVPVSNGVLVISVMRDSPAEQAGMQSNDVIVEFAGQKVRDSRDLQAAVEQKPLNSRQRVTVLRDQEQTLLEVVLQSLPDEEHTEEDPEDE